ncbi:hypothetical protein [Cellulomonas sp. URHB0016]
MTTDDHAAAAALGAARAALHRAGASDLPPRPWQAPGQPPSDTELVRFAAWASRDAASTDPDVVAAGLRLVASARAELDQVEIALLFAGRAGGMTWPQVASALGLGSPQAAQQRLDRTLSRLGGRDERDGRDPGERAP